jgi:hypothetical protein
VDEAAIQRVLCEVHSMSALAEVSVPESLIPAATLEELLASQRPSFVPVVGREEEGPKPPAETTCGVVQRRLSNGVMLNYMVTGNEPGSATARVCCSGGRAAEPRGGSGVGAMLVGLRARAHPAPLEFSFAAHSQMLSFAVVVSCVQLAP